jgi:hypothetical protein
MPCHAATQNSVSLSKEEINLVKSKSVPGTISPVKIEEMTARLNAICMNLE